MDNIFHESVVNNTFMDSNTLFNQVIGNLAIVDLGIIEHIENNRSDIQTFSFYAGSAIRHSNVEVVFVGADIIPDGTLCLLVKPKTSVPDTSNNITNMAVTPYHITGMKAIPLLNLDRDTHFGYTTDGSFTIRTEKYNVALTENNIGISINDMPFVSVSENEVDVDVAGLLHLSIDENTVSLSSYDNDGNEQYNTTLNEDGTKLINAGATDDGWNTTITLGDEGDVDVNTKKDVTLANEDTTVILLNDDKVLKVENSGGTITVDGQNTDITIEGKGTVNITNSSCKIEMSNSDVIINGHLKVLP